VALCIKSSYHIYICLGNDTLFYMAISRINALTKLARRKHVLRARDLDEIGIPRNYLLRLVHRGTLERIGRGLYAVPNADITEHQSLLEATLRVPNGVICLLSALRFHGLTTQAPFEVWIAIDRKAWKPRISSPPVRIVRFSGSAFTFGASVHKIGGTKLMSSILRRRLPTASSTGIRSASTSRSKRYAIAIARRKQLSIRSGKLPKYAV
jgi:predicted transcriptional regulator of viral defense system